MEHKRLIPGKWIAVLILVLASGCFYCCGGMRGEEALVQEEATGAEAVGNTGTAGYAESLAAPTEPETEPPCYVHVCGEVVSPGVYRMRSGQRAFEAIALAGGFTAEAAQEYLNLAQPVTDGMKLEVPDKLWAEQHAGAAGQSGEQIPGPGGQAHARVNINTASKEELMTLRGIGEARAEDIIRVREQRGGFGSIEEIMEVPGIKNAAFEKIRDDITV